jgi:asparagine synthase (glutamine-hydrolysing)
MSVIYGKCYLRQQHDVKNIDKELLLMQNSLNHWNADRSATWLNDSIGLGHLMLYNTPESLHEQLPFYDPSTATSITADARIDNRVELFEKLSIQLTEQNEITDSTLILKAYEKYGEDCVQHLIGDFAFAIYDEQKQQLFCARDQMGIKPFFYYNDADCFVFASEKKGILALPDTDKTIDRQFLYNKLIPFYDQPVDLTLYKKIKRLPPANSLTFNILKKEYNLKRYWTLDADKQIELDSIEEYHKQLLVHFDEAVRCRTRTAFPIGAELSGGLDSSAITGAAQKFLKQNNQHLLTFSNTLPNGVIDENLLQMDERKYMDEVIAFNHIEQPVYVTESVWDNKQEELDFALYVDDGLETWYPGWQLPGRKAAMERNVRTLLSGFPGDQMVTSLSKAWFLDHLEQKKYLKYVKGVSKPGEPFPILSPLIPHWFKYGVKIVKEQFGLYNPITKAASKIFHIPGRYKKKLEDYLWRDPVFRERLKSFRHWQKFILLKPIIAHRLESETRYSLYFRIEPRFPMADIRLTQFFSSIPNHLKYGGPLGRDIFRQSVGKYLPPLIRQRTGKMGSIAPFFKLPKTKGQISLSQLLKELPENELLNKADILKNIASPPLKTNPRQNWIKRPVPTLDVIYWLQKNPEALNN